MAKPDLFPSSFNATAWCAILSPVGFRRWFEVHHEMYGAVRISIRWGTINKLKAYSYLESACAVSVPG